MMPIQKTIDSTTITDSTMAAHAGQSCGIIANAAATSPTVAISVVHQKTRSSQTPMFSVRSLPGIRNEGEGDCAFMTVLQSSDRSRFPSVGALALSG
ncbi:hypothetical protein [Bifidobacterium callitrichos]|uniref:hypothetical protein n=1 Tax=Bifidobacterium callitrichos TaxID=762209 RepID=UPI000690958E|nr:hypothetical protein [Bifidobacterium callitrichos]